jgi:hypothetical protein
VTKTNPQDYATTPPAPVQVVLAPVSLNIGHSLELSALELLAVGLKVAYDHRSRDVVLVKSDLVVVNEHFHPGMPLSELMKRLSMTQPESTTAKRRSVLSILQERTIRS